jgi:hypothetical protein
MYSASLYPVGKPIFLQLHPRSIPPTASPSSQHSTGPSRCQRQNRRISTRCRSRRLLSSRRRDLARRALPRPRPRASSRENQQKRAKTSPPTRQKAPCYPKYIPSPHQVSPPRCRALLAVALLAGVGWKEMSSAGAVATAPSQTLGRGGGGAATAGRGGGSATTRSLGRAVGLPPPPRSGRRGGAASTTLPTTAPFTIDGSFGGGVPSSSASIEGFPFPPASSTPLFPSDDPSSPSW